MNRLPFTGKFKRWPMCPIALCNPSNFAWNRYLSSRVATMTRFLNVLSSKNRWRVYWSVGHSHKSCYTDFRFLQSPPQTSSIPSVPIYSPFHFLSRHSGLELSRFGCCVDVYAPKDVLWFDGKWFQRLDYYLTVHTYD